MEIDFSDKKLYNKKYIPLLRNNKRYNFLMWWGWSWKSVFISQKEIIKSFQIKDKIMCVRRIKDTLKDSCFAELKSRIREWDLEQYFKIKTSPLSIRNVLTWCEFIFRWLDDSEKLKSVEWVARIWIEEATEIKRDDFDQLDLRLRGKKEMQITATFNPTDAEHRLNTDFWMFWNTNQSECLHSTYTDNAFVWKEYKEVMDRLIITNKNYYNIYALGEWGVLEWMIFENWDTVKEIPKEAKLLWYWKDFGYTNDPTTLIAWYLYNNELYFDELIFERGLTNQDIIERYGELGISMDDEIWADSAEPKSIEEIYRGWYNIHWVTKWKDSIMYWIDIMKQYFIHITEKSWNLHKEFKKYVWAKDKTGKTLNKPIDLYNHWIDWARYLCMMTINQSSDNVSLF